MLPVNPSILPWKAGHKHSLCVTGPEQTDEVYLCAIRGLAAAFVVLKLTFIRGVNHSGSGHSSLSEALG